MTDERWTSILCLCVCMNVCVSLCVSWTSILGLCVCMYLCLSVCGCLCRCVCVSVCMCICLYVCLCVWMSVIFFMCVGVILSECVSVSVLVTQWVCLSIYMCVYICVWFVCVRNLRIPLTSILWKWNRLLHIIYNVEWINIIKETRKLAVLHLKFVDVRRIFECLRKFCRHLNLLEPAKFGPRAKPSDLSSRVLNST